jgi:hypothetical protein
MAGDAPARIEAHLAFAVGKNLDPLGIETVEARVGQDAPVGALEVVQPVDLALALEMAGGIREGLEALEKITKGRFDMPFERLAMAAQDIAVGAFHPGKAQTVAQAGCLSRSSLFCRHFLHQSAPKPTMPGHPLRMAD